MLLRTRVWSLGKLTEIDDAQARDDLGRLSAQVMAIVARSARTADGQAESVPADVVANRSGLNGG